MGVIVNGKDYRDFFRIKRNGIELSTGKILKENLVQSVMQPTLRDKFTIQQDNNLKHKAKYIAYRDDIECS